MKIIITDPMTAEETEVRRAQFNELFGSDFRVSCFMDITEFEDGA